MLFNTYLLTLIATWSISIQACPYLDQYSDSTSLNTPSPHLHIRSPQTDAGVADGVVQTAAADNGDVQAAQQDEDTNDRMIGDLATVGATTDVGRSIQNILLRKESAESTVAGYKPPFLGTRACKADTCCVWSYISKLLSLEFSGGTSRCNKYARAAIRLGFHDAGTWSSSLASSGQDFGGADGSIVLAPEEMKRTDNKGLEEIVAKIKIWQKMFGVGAADLIQFAAVHAVVTCPLGPRVRFFAGRKDSSTPSVPGLLPLVTDDANSLINLFEDKTIAPHELTALVGAHTTSQQFNFDPSRRGAPQDSTPGVWDVKFYNETVQDPAPRGVVRFPSDIVLAAHPKVSDEWTKFRMGNGVGQKHWNEDYATAYTRLSLLGVNNINQLTECSKVLPQARPAFGGAGIGFLDG